MTFFPHFQMVQVSVHNVESHLPPDAVELMCILFFINRELHLTLTHILFTTLSTLYDNLCVVFFCFFLGYLRDTIPGIQSVCPKVTKRNREILVFERKKEVFLQQIKN